MMLESGLRAAGSSFYAVKASGGGGAFALEGMLSLNQGFLFSAMIFAALGVHLIERDFMKASIWSFVAALCSYLGFIH